MAARAGSPARVEWAAPMSLTSHLADPASPFLAFMREHFPNTQALVRTTNKDLKGTPTIEPPAREGYPAGVIGAAADYRIRYFFPPVPSRRLIAYEGARRLKEGATHPNAPLMEGFDSMLRRMGPVAGQPTSSSARSTASSGG